MWHLSCHQSRRHRLRGGVDNASSRTRVAVPPRNLASPALPPTSLHHDVLSLCRGRIASVGGLAQHGPVRALTWDAEVISDSARDGVIGMPIPLSWLRSSWRAGQVHPARC
jgi:hypothetical protein